MTRPWTIALAVAAALAGAAAVYGVTRLTRVDAPAAVPAIRIDARTATQAAGDAPADPPARQSGTTTSGGSGSGSSGSSGSGSSGSSGSGSGGSSGSGSSGSGSSGSGSSGSGSSGSGSGSDDDFEPAPTEPRELGDDSGKGRGRGRGGDD